jgi:hypothetical protein
MAARRKILDVNDDKLASHEWSNSSDLLSCDNDCLHQSAPEVKLATINLIICLRLWSLESCEKVELVESDRGSVAAGDRMHADTG